MLATGLALILLTAQPADDRFAVVPVGTHHGEEFRALEPLGGIWCALQGDQFRRVRVDARPVRDEVLDGAGKTKTGRELRVVAPAGASARFLVRGLPPRRVNPFSLPDDPTWLGNGRPVTLGEAQLALKGEDGTHRLLLSSEGRTQQLFEQEGGELESWVLHWAGDLDGDGRLDLVLTADRSGNASTWRLFLSSRAKPGALVHEVAHYTQTGC